MIQSNIDFGPLRRGQITTAAAVLVVVSGDGSSPLDCFPAAGPAGGWPQFEEIERSAVGRQPVGCAAFGLDRLVVQQALKQLRCGLRVTPALDQDVQDLAFVINRAPQVHSLSADAAYHLVQMPARRRSPPPLLQSPGDQRAELDRPAPDRLVANVDAACRQELLDVTKTEAETEVQPHRLPDHICREAVAVERQRFHKTFSPPAAYTDFSGDLLALD